MIAHLCLSLLHLCAHEQPNQWGAQTLLKRSTVGSVSTEAEKAHLCQKLQNLFWNHQPGHCGLVMCWVGRPNQTVKDITTRHAIPPKLVVSVYTSEGGGDLPGRELTPADGAVSNVAWLAGAQVSSNGVGADCIVVAWVLTTGTLIVLCKREGLRKAVRVGAYVNVERVLTKGSFESLEDKKWRC